MGFFGIFIFDKQPSFVVAKLIIQLAELQCLKQATSSWKGGVDYVKRNAFTMCKHIDLLKSPKKRVSLLTILVKLKSLSYQMPYTLYLISRYKILLAHNHPPLKDNTYWALTKRFGVHLASYCDTYHANVVCQKNGRIMPTILERGSLVRVSMTLICIQLNIYDWPFVFSFIKRVFIRLDVDLSGGQVGCNNRLRMNSTKSIKLKK